MLNPFQKTCAVAYCGGEFAQVERLEDVRELGDTLFTFLMIELGTDEDCEDAAEAIRRLEAARTDIEDVRDAILAAQAP